MLTDTLHPPAPFRPDLRRPQVMATLHAAMDKPIVALICPGGFGKTCVLRSFWLESRSARAWLDLQRHPQEEVDSGLEAAIEAAGEQGLLVLDGIETLSAGTAASLARRLERTSRGLRVLLSGRNAGGLPLSLWRSQGRLASLNAHSLALSQDEWHAAGLDGEAADWAGWWGARQASLHPAAGWDPELAQWLDLAWLGALDDEAIADLGRASLLPEADVESLAALGAGAQAERNLIQVAMLAGPLCLPTGGLKLASRYRPYLVAAWRSRDPQACQQAVEAGTASLLTRGAAHLAARLALEIGEPLTGARLANEVLLAAGWQLLYSRHRNLLRNLLDASPGEAESPHHVLLDAAWKVEVIKRPHEAEAEVNRLAAMEDAAIAGPAHALLASIAYQYDAFSCALGHADDARAILTDDLHPASSLTELARAGCAQAGGDMAAAEAGLRHVLACADRDRLDHLQIEALHRRAVGAAEAGDTDLALRWTAERRQRIRFAGLETPETLDCSARLEANLRLRRLEVAAARRALEAGRAAANTYGDYWSFPYATIEVLADLIEGNSDAAREGVAWLEAQIAERFLCLKWRAEALLPRIWLRARDADRNGLLELASRAQAEDWPDTLYRDRRDLFCAGARLLAGETPDAAPLHALVKRRTDSGANEVARLGRRLLALMEPDSGVLLEEVRSAAANRDRLDWLWLAPRALAPLESLLGDPAIAGDALSRNYLREVVQGLLAPRISATSEAPRQPAIESAPPAGLTLKEWEVLKLIGEQLTNEQIAARLFVSLATIKTHINHIYSKLDLHSRSEAVLKARTL